MVSLNYKAARGLCDKQVAEGGVFKAWFSGLICRSAFCLFREEIIRRAAPAGAIIVDMGQSVLLMDEPPEITPEIFGNMPPAALIAKREELWFWSDYARRCADIGITITVFLPEQYGLAVRWAEALARQAA